MFETAKFTTTPEFFSFSTAEFDKMAGPKDTKKGT